MRSDARFARSGLVAGAFVLLAAAVCAQPASLSRAFTVEDDRSAEPDFIKERRVEQMEQWRREAVGILLKTGDQVSAAEDYLVIKTGNGRRRDGKNLGEAFADELTDSRLEAAFDHGRSHETKTIDNAMGRIAVANLVLRRPALSARHAEARYERATLSILTTEDRDAAVRGVAEAREASGVETDFGRKASATLNALQGPASEEDFAASLDLMRMATYMNGRMQMNWITSPLLGLHRDQGLAAFAPARFEGSGTPLLALAQAAFDTNRYLVLDDIEANLPQMMPTDVGRVAGIKYWVAMGYFSKEQHAEALPRFEEIAATGSGDKFEADSMIRAGQCHQSLDRPLEAAVWYMDARERFPQFQNTVTSASDYFEFLAVNGFIDTAEAEALHRTRRDAREAAMLGKGGK